MELASWLVSSFVRTCTYWTMLRYSVN